MAPPSAVCPIETRSKNDSTANRQPQHPGRGRSLSEAHRQERREVATDSGDGPRVRGTGIFRAALKSVSAVCDRAYERHLGSAVPCGSRPLGGRRFQGHRRRGRSPSVRPGAARRRAVRRQLLHPQPRPESWAKFAATSWWSRSGVGWPAGAFHLTFTSEEKKLRLWVLARPPRR